jgi:hypothetical protein
MSDRKWDEYRCGQLADLETVLRTVRDANNANNFIKRMAGASVLAESLLDGTYPSFILFLHGLASTERLAQRQVDELHELLDDFERMITHSEDADTTVNQIVERIHRMRDLHHVK